MMTASRSAGGAQYNLTQNFGVRAEYTRFEGSDDGANAWGLSGVLKILSGAA